MKLQRNAHLFCQIVTNCLLHNYSNNGRVVLPWLFTGQTYLCWALEAGIAWWQETLDRKFQEDDSLQSQYQELSFVYPAHSATKSVSQPAVVKWLQNQQACHTVINNVTYQSGLPNDQNERKGEAGIQWLAAVLHCSRSRLRYLWMELCAAKEQKAMHTIPSWTFWPHSSVSRICTLGCLGVDSQWQQNDFSSHSFC